MADRLVYVKVVQLVDEKVAQLVSQMAYDLELLLADQKVLRWVGRKDKRLALLRVYSTAARSAALMAYLLVDHSAVLKDGLTADR